MSLQRGNGNALWDESISFLFNSSVVTQHALKRKKYKKTTVDTLTGFLSALKRLAETLFTSNLFA